LRKRYPQAGEIYESVLYPGQRCKVSGVLNAVVTFEWLGSYRHIDSQTALVSRFVEDFVFSDRESSSAHSDIA